MTPDRKVHPSANTGRPKAIPADWIPEIRDYLLYLSAAGQSTNTIQLRKYHLARLARALTPSPPSGISGERLVRFYASQSWGSEYRRSHQSTVIRFYAWMVENGRLKSSPARSLPRVRPAKPTPRPTPDTVWDGCREAADARTMVMLLLACRLGMRREEVSVASTDDIITVPDGHDLLIHGKGGASRIVPLPIDMYEIIRAGAAGHTPGGATTGYLFPGSDNGHLSARWVGTLCSRAMPGPWTMHTLRHRFASKRYRASQSNIRLVQELLGHASVATTQIYTIVEDADKRAAMNSAA